jgi:NAD(P) transhydrogenase
VYDYDLLVLGSGPSGQKAAIAAAKLGKRVGIVDRRDMIGGVCINTGTVPPRRCARRSSTSPAEPADLYGSSYRVKDEITVSDLAARTQHVITRQTDVIRNQLARNHVAMITGTGGSPTPIRSGSTAAMGETPRSAPTRSSSPPARGPRGRTASTSTTVRSSTPTA